MFSLERKEKNTPRQVGKFGAANGREAGLEGRFAKERKGKNRI